MTAGELRSALADIEVFLPRLTEDEARALAAHVDLLLHWNRKINLTAVRDPALAVRKHVGESLYLAAGIPGDALTVCDLGSGGGFPGIPVAILRPGTRVTLVESDVRKSVFLREASRSLSNVTVLAKRIEDVGGGFEWLISRAVNLSSLKDAPEFGRAAVLGGGSLGEKRGLLERFTWTRGPIPWDGNGFLWLGDVSRET